MQKLTIFYAFTLTLAACQESEDPPPDLEQISRVYCEVRQMCNSDETFATQDACESYQRTALVGKDTDHPECFDARVTWMECVASFETCEEYEEYLRAHGEKCLQEGGAFYNYCMALSPF